MTTLKKQLYTKIVATTQQRVADIEAIIKETQNSANNETKSSAGDKHETGRSMAQLETEKLNAQLTEALKLTKILSKINPTQQHQLVGLGSLVLTNNGNFFIGASLGEVELDNQIYFAMSAISPIGKLLVGLKKADTFSFQNKRYSIKYIH